MYGYFRFTLKPHSKLLHHQKFSQIFALVIHFTHIFSYVYRMKLAMTILQFSIRIILQIRQFSKSQTTKCLQTTSTKDHCRQCQCPRIARLQHQDDLQQPACQDALKYPQKSTNRSFHQYFQIPINDSLEIRLVTQADR